MLLLEPVSDVAPTGLESMLHELGGGEAGFSGTPFGRGEMALSEYLDYCIKSKDPKYVTTGRVPQTIFWVVEDRIALGMLRMRHYLNEALRVKSGHIGYYIRPSARRRGLATEALAQALQTLVTFGEQKAFLTTDPDNLASIRTIESNGGNLVGQVPDPDGPGLINQYWIDLT